MSDSTRLARRPAPSFPIRTAVPICLLALLASGCTSGGGGGGGDGTPLFQVPLDDDATTAASTIATQPTTDTQTSLDPPVVMEPSLDPPIVTQPPVDPPIVTQPPVDPPIVTDPPVDPPIVTDPPIDPPIVTDPPIDPPIVTDPPVDPPIITDPPVDPSIIADPPFEPDSSLSALFGNATFVWSFTNDAQQFEQTIGFTPDGLSVGDDDDELLIASDPGNFEAFICGSIQTDNYFCLGGLASGDKVVFLFQLDPGAATGSGSFEFCDANTDGGECVDDLLRAPDGPVTVTIAPLPAASAPASADRDVATEDLSDWMIGLDQADGGSANTRTAPDGNVEAISRRLETMTCTFEGHCI